MKTRFIARQLFRSGVLLLALVGTALAYAACARESQSSVPPARAASTIPPLKPRPAGLAAAEFQAVERQVAGLFARIAAKPNDPEGYTRLAIVYMNEARITGDHPYYYPAAEGLLDRALGLDSGNYLALVSKGSVLLSLHRFTEALAIGERAKAIAPASAYVYGILCDASVELGKYEEAVRSADRMVAIRPDLKSYSRVSYLREIHGDMEGAISAMKLAVESGAPGSEEKAWARYTLGMLHLEHGQLAAAERELTLTGIERENYPFAFAGRARVAAARGKNDLALRLLDSAERLIPEFSFLEIRGELARARGDRRAADSLVAVVEGMLAEDEASGHVMDRELAFLYANNDTKPDSAVARARRELARRPANIDAQHTMAWTLLRAGRAAEAERYIRDAMRTNKQSAELFAHAALIEAANGRTERAKELGRKARTINPHLSARLLRELEGVAGEG